MNNVPLSDLPEKGQGTRGATEFPLPLETEQMEARAVDALPDGDDWQFEPKWDGFRCLAFKGKRRGGDRARIDLMIGADADPAIRLPG